VAYAENDTSTAVQWWTRTTTGGTHPYCRAVGSNGSCFFNRSYYDSNYLRPIIDIYSNNYLEKISDGVYRMVGSGKQTNIELINFTVDGVTY
jgi:hypothetical protein